MSRNILFQLGINNVRRDLRMFTFENEYVCVAVTINGVKYGTSYLNTKGQDGSHKCTAIEWQEKVDDESAS